MYYNWPKNVRLTVCIEILISDCNWNIHIYICINRLSVTK